MVAIKSLFTVASVLAVAGFVNAAPAALEKRITHTGKATYFAVGLVSVSTADLFSEEPHN
jgi:hypothetical protein